LRLWLHDDVDIQYGQNLRRALAAVSLTWSGASSIPDPPTETERLHNEKQHRQNIATAYTLLHYGCRQAEVKWCRQGFSDMEKNPNLLETNAHLRYTAKYSANESLF